MFTYNIDENGTVDLLTDGMEDGDKLDRLYDMYKEYKMLSECAKEQMYSLSAQLLGAGVSYTPSGRRIEKKARVNNKIDSMMLSVMHNDVYKTLFELGVLEPSAKDIKPYLEQIEDCITPSETITYSLKGLVQQDILKY